MASENTDEKELFWDLVDEFIKLANEKSHDIDLGIVNSALLSASARYSSFYVAVNAASKRDLVDDKSESVQYLGGQYKKQLAENLEDYIDHFDSFVEK